MKEKFILWLKQNKVALVIILLVAGFFVYKQATEPKPLPAGFFELPKEYFEYKYYGSFTVVDGKKAFVWRGTGDVNINFVPSDTLVVKSGQPLEKP